jgi:hypothetical protein
MAGSRSPAAAPASGLTADRNARGQNRLANRASGLLRINDIDERMELENAATVSLFERILDQAGPGNAGIGGAWCPPVPS